MTCPICMSLEFAPEDQLRRLVQDQARQLDRLTADAGSFQNAALRVRITELELEVMELRRNLEVVNGRLAATRKAS